MSLTVLNDYNVCLVEGEDDAHEVTAGCVVTVRVTLTRNSLLDPQVAGLEDERLRTEEEDDSDNVSGESDCEQETKDEQDIKDEHDTKDAEASPADAKVTFLFG